jgi:hypothetical protein
LIQPVAHWDVEVADLPIVKDVAAQWVVEGFLIVEDALLKGVDPILVLLDCNSGIRLPVGDGLKEPISDASKECCIELRLHLEGGLNGARGEGDQGQREYMAWRELEWGFTW